MLCLTVKVENNKSITDIIEATGVVFSTLTNLRPFQNFDPCCLVATGAKMTPSCKQYSINCNQNLTFDNVINKILFLPLLQMGSKISKYFMC